MAKLRISAMGKAENFNKVACIKAVRALTGLGLKETKDAVESAMTGIVVEFDRLDPQRTVDADQAHLETLRANGLELNANIGKVDFILAALKESAKLAADEGEEELAIAILSAIKEHKSVVAERDAKIRNDFELARERAHAERVRKGVETEMRNQADQQFQEAQRFRQTETIKDQWA